MVFTFSLSEGLKIITPLFLFVVAMTLYSIFVFKFYRFVATRDIFELNLQQYKSQSKWGWIKMISSILLYILEYLILFPIFVFLWFAVFSILLLLLSRQEFSIILLISMAIVSAVRVASYYSEDLSKDLAKMLPFALLGIFLIDISFFSLETIPDALAQIPSLLDTIIYYLIFAIVIELILRLVTLILGIESFSGETLIEK